MTETLSEEWGHRSATGHIRSVWYWHTTKSHFKIWSPYRLISQPTCVKTPQHLLKHIKIECRYTISQYLFHSSCLPQYRQTIPILCTHFVFYPAVPRCLTCTLCGLALMHCFQTIAAPFLPVCILNLFLLLSVLRVSIFMMIPCVCPKHFWGLPGKSLSDLALNWPAWLNKGGWMKTNILALR